MSLARDGSRRLRILHLLPDLLGVYGDSGNVRTLAARATWRGIDVDVATVLADAAAVPDADVLVIGGGQDRDQVQVDRALRRIGDGIVRQVQDGAALLAVCAGYQSLGREYRTMDGPVLRGPGLLDVETVSGGDRLVGPVLAQVSTRHLATVRSTLVGFENHAGRTAIGRRATPLAHIEIGHGNNDQDATEGILELPGDRGLLGLRIGTYLHGPFLPRNPHIADLLLVAALQARGQPVELDPLDDGPEWAAHDRFVARLRRRSWSDRLPTRIRRATDPARSLIGF